LRITPPSCLNTCGYCECSGGLCRGNMPQSRTRDMKMPSRFSV
jgi:hypothetical protein